MSNKKLQLLRNGNIYTPSNGATALETAMSAISQMQNVSDGEVILARYRESQNSGVKTLLCIYYDGSMENGWTFLGDVDTSGFVKKPVVLYETNGTTGLLGVNDGTIGDNNWQLTGYDFTPYKYLRCYVKMADLSSTSESITSSMVIELPLDAASRAQSAGDSTQSDPKTPCNMYISGGAVPDPLDHNSMLTVLVAVDSTKTKFKVVFENSFDAYFPDVSTYSSQDDRNTNGRYIYKIEGCYDSVNNASESSFVETDPVFLASPAHGITSANITAWNSYQNLDKTPLAETVPVSSLQTIDPYKMYDFGTLSTSLTISFNTQLEVSGYVREYILRFVAGNGCGITLPSGVLYANGTTPTYTAGHTYEIDIINNCAVVAEFY